MTAAVAGESSRRILAAGAVVLAVYLFFANPYSTGGWLPPCLFHSWTGLYCPGCGSTRAFHELLHGQLAAALHLNAFTILTVPLIAVFLLLPARWTARRPATWRWGAAYALAAVLFAVLRNLPQFSFLAP